MENILNSKHEYVAVVCDVINLWAHYFDRVEAGWAKS